MRDLDSYLAMAKLTNNHYRYMSEEVKQEIADRTPNCNSMSLDERMYWLKNGLTDYPNCKHCGSVLDSSSWYASTTKQNQAKGWPQKGYRPFCSRKCAAASDQKQASFKQTCVEKYGVDHPLRSETVQAKRKLTNLERYGQTHPHAWSSDRFAEYVKKLHGVLSVRHIDGVSEKIANTKAKETGKRLREKVTELEGLYEVKLLSDLPDSAQRMSDIELNWRHSCGKEFTSNITVRGLRSCPRCSSSSSRAEREIGDWLEAQGLKVIRRDTKTLGVELDLYIPEKKIAIEYDGTYWHSARFVSAEKSMRKLVLAEQRGIQLLTIQEHQYVMRQEQVFSRLASILGLNSKMYARKCDVRLIPNQEANIFFSTAHLQGGARAQHAYGLFQDDELVAAMSFAKPRFSKKTRWELIRFACKPGVSVVGGASRILKAFRNDHQGSILSYADRCWSTGKLYESLGFSFIQNSAPSYFWVSGKFGVFSRYQTQKKKLSKLMELCGQQFDEALSEDDNMQLARFLKVYDRGNSVWILE